jgi:hypothetical protein
VGDRHCLDTAHFLFLFFLWVGVCVCVFKRCERQNKIWKKIARSAPQPLVPSEEEEETGSGYDAKMCAALPNDVSGAAAMNGGGADVLMFQSRQWQACASPHFAPGR